MIKLVFCARRHPDLTAEQFRDYWLNHHGQLFKRFASTYKAIRYVQSHTLDTHLNEGMLKSRGMQTGYDGVGEIWWKDEQDFIDAISSPEGQKLRSIFIEDESRFIDLANSCAFFTEEHILIDEAA